MGQDILFVLFVILAVIVGLIGLAAFALGAFDLFASANRQGFVGLAAFIACWVFFAPVMAVISVLIGLFGLYLIAKDRWF